MIIGIDPERVVAVAAEGDDDWAPVSEFVVGQPIFIGAGENQPTGPWYRFKNEEGDFVYGPLSTLSLLGVRGAD